MLPLFGIFASSFVIALSGALMPGPLLSTTISESSKKGFWAGPMLIMGHGILELALVLALIAGLAPILKKDFIFGLIGVIGAVILLWMAYGMFQSLTDLKIQIQNDLNFKGNLVLSGILMSLANPYWTIWWATIGLGYIFHSMGLGFIGVLSFFTGHILADLVWYSLVSFLIARGRSFLSLRVYKSIIVLCAGFLIFFACYVGYIGLGKLS
ncbi:MAG: LysE family translocator [Deltaproteobacteria bacterium]|nr:LysE family translocator [Deltaproteobacteria bacterium]